MEPRHTPKYVSTIAREMPWLIVIGFVAISFYSISTPPPNEAVTSNRFSATAAMQHIEVIAQEPHPMGTAEIAEVRGYILAELRQLGLDPELQPLQAPDPFFNPGATVDVVNIIARVPGTGGETALALMAHYDTVPATPGANDNTASVATLLETARVLMADEPLANDVILLFTDGEEPAPRFGAPAFVERHPDFADIGFVVNFETSGGSGPSMVVETSGAESWIIDEYSAAAERPVAFSFITEIVRAMGDIGTDFDSFRNAGIPGLHFAYMRGSPIYHTAADNVEAVSLRSVQHHGDNAVEIVRRFGNLDLEEAGTNTAAIVYFTLRPAFITYPAWVGWAVLALAAGLVTMAIHRRGLAPGRVLTAGGRTLLGAIGASLVGTLLWVVVTMVRDTPSVLEAYGFLLIIGGVVAWLTNRTLKGRDAQHSRDPITLVWILFGVLTIALLPGASYLFVWPALALATAANLQSSSRQRLVGFVATAAATLLLLVPAVEFFWQFGQPRPGNPDSSVPAIVVVAFLLLALVGAALRSVWWRPEILIASRAQRPG